jgi:hypothetical protein
MILKGWKLLPEQLFEAGEEARISLRICQKFLEG